MTESEFESHILPCYRKMYITAMHVVRDSDEACDIVQESFARLWERRTEIGNPDNPEGYCVTVVKRMCIDRLRHRNLAQSVSIDEAPVAADNSTERAIDAGDTIDRLRNLLSGLPEQQRRVIHLSSVAGLDNSEIAEATGLSNVNVRALLSRGRKQLRKLFETQGYE